MLSLLFVALATSAAVVSPFITSSPQWYQPAEPFRVIDTIHYVGSRGISAWLLNTPKGLILLDVGPPENAQMVEDNIRKLGFNLRDIKILLNSHAHFDHAGGLAKLKADTGAKLYASAGDRLALEKGVYPGSEDKHMLDMPPVVVDHVLRDGEKVTLGGTSLTVMLTPGHSEGCTSYAMQVNEEGQRHSVFFFCSATVALNRLAPNPQYPGVVADFQKTFARLKGVKADVFLAPHSDFFDLDAKRAKLAKAGANPFIVPGEAQQVFAKQQAEFESARAKAMAAH